MGNVNIRFVNDGKDKHQSYEAHLDVTSFEAMNHCTCSFTGYGSTEFEAYDNLCKAIENLYGIHTIVNDYIMNHHPALWEQLQQRWYRKMQQIQPYFTINREDICITNIKDNLSSRKSLVDNIDDRYKAYDQTMSHLSNRNIDRT